LLFADIVLEESLNQPTISADCIWGACDLSNKKLTIPIAWITPTGSVASVFTLCVFHQNLDFRHYDAINILKFSKVETLLLDPTICPF